MNKLQLILGGFVAAALAGCGAGAAGPPSQTQVNVAAQSSLQFVIGTANIAGVAGMNVVSTFRQPNGQSATLLNTPTLTGPFTFGTLVPVVNSTNATASTVSAGPSAAEAGTATIPSNCTVVPCITGTPQVAAGTPLAQYPFQSTFGTSGGAFALGFAPANYTSSGAPSSLVPYAVPLYSATTQFIPWGGPPAYDSNATGKGTRDGTFPSGLLGVSEGLSIFQGVVVGAGAYNLKVNVAAANAPSTAFTATYAAPAPVTLATIATPTIAFDATDDPSVTFVMPAGFVGEYIQIGDYASATATAAKTYYTFWSTAAAGTVTVTPAMAPGAPGTTAKPVATGDTVRVNIVGFDYNHYALTANLPLNSAYPQTPALPARADVSISAQATGVAP